MRVPSLCRLRVPSLSYVFRSILAARQSGLQSFED
jgi:hypothetical protein